MDKELEEKYRKNPLAQAILKEGLAIQDRFSSKPVLGPTGRGYLKSVGVEEIAEAKETAQGRHNPPK